MMRQSKEVASLPPRVYFSDMQDDATIAERIEFHRNVVALLPKKQDAQQGIAIMVLAEKEALSYRGCSCSDFRSKTCRHIKDLSHILKACRSGERPIGLFDEFRNSVWYHLAQLLSDADRTPCESIRVVAASRDDLPCFQVVGPQDEVLVDYYSGGADRDRFISRIRGNSDEPYSTRCDVLKRLALFTLSENERKLMDMGMKTRRQAMEESVWFRMAYHAFRELGAGGFSWNHEIDKASGQFRICVVGAGQAVPFRFVVPKNAADRLLSDPAVPVSSNRKITLSAASVKPVLKIRKDSRGALRLSPVYLYQPEDGRQRQFSHRQVKKFTFGTLFYLSQSDMMVPIAPPDALFKAYGGRLNTTIRKADVPDFLKTYGELIRNSANLLGDSTKGLEVFNAPSHIKICPSALERDWCWLSATYGFGNSSLSLDKIIQARKDRQRYVSIEDGWVDVRAPGIESIFNIFDSKEAIGDETDGFRLKRMHLFRLAVALNNNAEVLGETPAADLIRQMLTLKSTSLPPKADRMTSALRTYQQRGLEWLWFLYENGFGGLLCDDMGLGKTHQIMAWMLCLKAKHRGPFLVVCPTTVISHWEKKIRQHAPSLKAAVYYGQDRNLKDMLEDVHLLITSYGIVLRDVAKLAEIAFSLAVFDEIQQIKNAETKSFKASCALRADMKVGLTGTPIENCLWDLKSMMDLVLPDYLGSDASFKRLYVDAVENDATSSQPQALSRIIFPFTLRRLKASVLAELPEKIEDLRFCLLSEDQVKLYREALDSRRMGIMEKLQSPQADIPYIHIFALLTLLKQICNHPAQLEDVPETYHQLSSGKWELFTELLTEALESGQKVVVYSQFVKMIRIIELYLSENKIDHVVLTGQSRKRGDLIERFNEDSACRVFVGSLKAGGTGIDLVAASVVIHYDRWWNAAKEDQATDRVHRIGQRRGVQVFKLVTEGTLEEKISAIIAKKKNLMDRVVREDDPGLLKTFSREELIGLLAPADLATESGI
ncbi:MAG: DEAD/DEAH box helicase [Desulfobacterales bacterium]|nr:DEAD/DEAH box helicase [Desulfobacterales bacterium]